MDEHEIKVYDSIGIGCSTIIEHGKKYEAISLLFPTETTPIDGECEERYMTLPAAKALLLDLRDAIEACEKEIEKR